MNNYTNSIAARTDRSPPASPPSPESLAPPHRTPDDDPDADSPSALRPASGHFLLGPQPFREKAPDFPLMPPHQPLQVQDARPILVRIPGRPVPPVHLPGRLQA